jgi:Domain of unknown function (DUF3883)
MEIRTSVVKGQVGNTKVHGKPIPGKIMVRDTRTELQIYVHPRSMVHGRLPPIDASEELCKYCGIGDERLKRLVVEVLLQDDPQEIEDMLSRQRVGGFDVNDLDAVPIQVTAQDAAMSFGNLQKPATNTQVRAEMQKDPIIPTQQIYSHETDLPPEPAVLNEIVNESNPPKLSSLGSSSSGPVSELKARELKQAARHAEVGASVRIGGRENIPLQSLASFDGSFSTKKVKPNKVMRPVIRPARRTSPQKFDNENPVVKMTHRNQSREENIGIEGEVAVFYILKDIFGGAIEESAWTSELRQHVKGFKPWSPPDCDILYSDFTVRDQHGKLTNWMNANNVKFPADWQSEDLLYYIEVKSTAKNLEDPFFMSHLQMKEAQKHAETRTKDPREVFVIFRVYDVESEEPGLEIYCDPWIMIKEGALRCETQEWRVRVA